ncbi:MAG: transcriptional regulator [Desulfobulbaceae bacterium]|nr:transcriptional regulator [Desulfobulbaceae bacterium]
MRNTKKSVYLSSSLLTFIAFAATTFLTLSLQAAELPSWYRIRTNSIPHQPNNVITDAQGGVWVTAQDGTEYEPGLWYHALTAGSGEFQYFTNNRRNNYLAPGYSSLVEKPELDTSLLYATQDNQNNTWYALKNRTVLCEKGDGSWLTFTMQDTSYLGGDTTNVDSVHRIRLIDGQPAAGQAKLLISARGVIHLDADFNVVPPSRVVYDNYNNSFINDVLIDSQGRFWIASNNGVEKGTSLLNTVWIDDDSDLLAPPLYTPITRIEEDTLGNIWLASNAYGASGIYCYTVNDEWEKYDLSTITELLSASNQVYDLSQGSSGSLWIGAIGSGLIHYSPVATGSKWSRTTGAQLGLESEQLISLASTDEGLWFVSGYNPSVSGNGTGVHYLTFDQTGQPQVESSTYRGQSTSLTSNRINMAAADKSGGVWFPAYDDPSIARLKTDGSWVQYLGGIGNQLFGSSSIIAAAVDSNNLIYLAPQNLPPVAYDINSEQLVTLPNFPYSEAYYYGLHIDINNGKWFCGAFGVYYLNPGNTAWTRYNSIENPGSFADNYVEAVLVDDAQNAWFSTRYGLTLMKNNPEGGSPEWFLFARDDQHSGYTANSYRVLVDDNGQVWNTDKQQFDSETNTWAAVTNTSAYDSRHLRFLNGRIPANMDMTGALPDVTTTAQDSMTIDTKGQVYFAGGMVGPSSVNAGIVVRSPVTGDIDRNCLIQLDDALYGLMIISGLSSPAQAYPVEVDSDGKIGLVETLFILRSLAEMQE